MIVKINKLDSFGNGIAYIDNKTVFVRRALPGETVEIEIYKEKKNISFAKIINIIEPSSERRKSICPYYDRCGGCDFLHTTDEVEKEFKINKAKYLFNRCDNYYETENLNYRNKVVLHSKNGHYGFYQEETNDLVEIDYCYIADYKINEIIKSLRKDNIWGDFDVTIRSFDGDILLSLDGDINNITFYDTAKIVKTIIVNNKVILGNGYLYFYINDYKIRLGSKAFFQVNLEGLNNIYKIISNFLKDKKINKALDLYSGVSLWSILINKFVDNIDSIEINEEACLNGKNNLIENNIHNVNIINGKVEDYIDKFSDIDLVITDPPRSGMDKKTIDYLSKINSKYIIYISCNIDTLKRDLDRLDNYELKELDLVNMFKRTYHCEVVTILERK
jgi:23S rRNA (uracil1939-C5)-methyltransferase